MGLDCSTRRRMRGGGVGRRVAMGALCVWMMMMAVCLCSRTASASKCSKRARKVCGPSSFSFYLHNMVWNQLVNNTDTFNSVYSAPPPNATFPNPAFFGVTSTFEDPLTIGPDNSSLRIGTAHGFYFFDGKVDFTLFHIFTANITEGDYIGTIDIFGQVREIDPVRYLTVIGGTGDFLLARGLAACRLIELYRGPPGAARWTLSFDLDLYY